MTYFVELVILSDLSPDALSQTNLVSLDSIRRVAKLEGIDTRCRVTVVIGNQTHEWYVASSYDSILAELTRVRR